MASAAAITTISINDLRTNVVRTVRLSADQTDSPGWSELVSGWSLGPMGSGAVLEVDEPALSGHRLSILQAGGHLFVYGRLGPDVGMLHIWRGSGTHAQEMQLTPDEKLELRFDSAPLQIGDTVITWISAPQL